MSCMFFFRVKHMRISEKTCRSLMDHTRQRLLMFLTLCQLITRGVFGKCPVFCTKFCKGETTLYLRKLTHEIHVNAECWLNWFDAVLFISLTNRWSSRVYGDSLTWRVQVLINSWTEGLSEQMHNLTDRYPDCCNYWLISRLSVWMYNQTDR